MKTLLIVFLALSGIGGTIAVLTYQKPAVTEVTVLRDVTDKELAQPDATAITNLFNLSDIWNGAIFRFSNLTDVSMDRTLKAEIDPANEWLSNELEREKEVTGFQDSVSGILADAVQDTTGRWHSSLYLPIANQLITLSQSKAQKKVLLIYSDLMENEYELSFYNAKTFSLLQSNPDSIEKLLESWQPLPSLAGIEVYLIYQPAGVITDNQYRVVSGFYRHMLQQKGATVYISANLSN